MEFVMRIVLLAIALAPAAASAAPRDPVPQRVTTSGGKACEKTAPEMAQAGKPVRIRKLGEEPKAAQYLGVLRLEDGCDRPVKIRDDVGDEQR
jgi:hypothetical protein